MDRQKEYKSENKMKDCLAYFHLSPVWEKVLKGFREKYISYGRFGGKVILKNLKPTDIEELEGFFGKSFHSQKSVTVSSEKFRQALETSRYKEITPECLLENFFEEPLLGRQEQKSLREQEKERIWEIFQRDYEGTPVETALESLRSIVKDNGSQELAKWDKMLRLGAEIYNNLPYRSTKMYLAVFAAMRTGNPHAFDIGTADGNFLYQIIQMDLEIRRITVETSAIFPAYKRQKSYLLAGIMLDDVSNYTMLYQVQAVKKDGNYHKGMAGFAKEQHIVQVPLAVLTEWDALYCPQNEIYIVENPSVFAMLCGKEETDHKEKAYMCMNGQPRLAGLMALDLLAKSETRIYYAGDLDPEGVLIAQKLSQYYKGEFYYWHMEAADYERCRSKEVISNCSDSRRFQIIFFLTLRDSIFFIQCKNQFHCNHCATDIFIWIRTVRLFWIDNCICQRKLVFSPFFCIFKRDLVVIRHYHCHAHFFCKCNLICSRNSIVTGHDRIYSILFCFLYKMIMNSISICNAVRNISIYIRPQAFKSF